MIVIDLSFVAAVVNVKYTARSVCMCIIFVLPHKKTTPHGTRRYSMCLAIISRLEAAFFLLSVNASVIDLPEAAHRELLVQIQVTETTDSLGVKSLAVIEKTSTKLCHQ